MNTTTGGALVALSNDIAAAIEAVAANVVAVEGRDGIGSSGFFVGPNTILTADHALEAEGVEIVHADGRSETATIAGRDPGTDLALLTVATGGPAALTVAPDSQVRVGTIAIAVARDDDGDLNATMGVIGSIGAAWRTWRGGEIDRFIRADVSLSPRFSGSPLVDATGTLVGLCTWGLSRRQALIVPAGTIGRVVDALRTRGHVARGYLGVAMQSIALPDRFGGGSGVIVLGVAPGGPADRGGLLVGDIITTILGRRIDDSDDAQRLLDGTPAGTSGIVGILRGGQPLEFPVTIGERPDHHDR